MLAAQEDPVDSADSEDVHSAAALLAQVPVLAVVKAGLQWPAVLARVTAAPVVLAQPMVVLAVALEAEALVDLLRRQSFSAAMARNTT